MKHENLLVGCDSFADAAVYRLREDLALVQTLDFFTPVVDDPYLFGQIAAANALSDVYAMGAQPLTAMNIVCFPSRTLDLTILGDILRGGAHKVLEAGALIVGGHSVEDNEPKYGLSVTGTVHPHKLITNSNAKPGDCLILTKPLGSGLILTAAKAEMAVPNELETAILVMKALNRDASLAMSAIGVNAATDITGFGFLGHAREVAIASGVSLEISFSRIPLLRGALRAAGMGLVPGGAYANWENVAAGITVVNKTSVGQRELDVLCDPQTSGGLLIFASQAKEQELLAALAARNVAAATVGRVTDGKQGNIAILA